jgi:excisionase family DNA binding protein
VRYVEGSPYYTIGEVAETAGVSAQTVREWERLGHFSAIRTAGGHRLFSEETVRSVLDLVTQRRRSRVTRPGGPSPSAGTRIDWSLASTGARVRAAREDGRLSQAALAEKTGISRSLLSSIERGVCGASVQTFSRIAEVLEIPMSSLAPARPRGQQIMRADQRPETELAGNVRWLELAAPGHTMAPALLHVPPGAASGGSVTLTRENFITVVEGTLEFVIAELGGWFALHVDDSIVLAPGQTHAWRNPSAKDAATVLWVEQLAAGGPPAQNTSPEIPSADV